MKKKKTVVINREGVVLGTPPELYKYPNTKNDIDHGNVRYEDVESESNEYQDENKRNDTVNKYDNDKKMYNQDENEDLNATNDENVNYYDMKNANINFYDNTKQNDNTQSHLNKSHQSNVLNMINEEKRTCSYKMDNDYDYTDIPNQNINNEMYKKSSYNPNYDMESRNIKGYDYYNKNDYDKSNQEYNYDPNYKQTEYDKSNYEYDKTDYEYDRTNYVQNEMYNNLQNDPTYKDDYQNIPFQTPCPVYADFAKQYESFHDPNLLVKSRSDYDNVNFDRKFKSSFYDKSEQPLYVNVKQFHCIRKRKMRRDFLDTLMKQQNSGYLHESRHRHAMNRMRAPSGRFLTKEETAKMKKGIDDQKY